MAAKKDEKAGLIKVTQTGSPIGRHHRQRENLVGLGLNKIGRSKVWPDSPQVRGKIDKVHHLVKVEAAEG
ncbi:MAG: 50S ribosomal protein L30 [Geminicoccaceae bacterium]